MSCPQLGLTAPHPGTNSNISTRTREGQLLTRKWAKDQNIRKSKGRALLRKKCVTLGCDFPRGNEILSLQNSDTPSGRRVSLCGEESLQPPRNWPLRGSNTKLPERAPLRAGLSRPLHSSTRHLPPSSVLGRGDGPGWRTNEQPRFCGPDFVSLFALDRLMLIWIVSKGCGFCV